MFHLRPNLDLISKKIVTISFAWGCKRRNQQGLVTRPGVSLMDMLTMTFYEQIQKHDIHISCKIGGDSLLWNMPPCVPNNRPT